MRYFKAIEILEKPFIIWQKIADNIEELTEMGQADNPLIISENFIPDFIFGVCPLKIVDGELVKRTIAEMGDFETQYNNQILLQDQAQLIQGINQGTFNFDFGIFPIDERSRLLYDALKNTATPIPDIVIMNFEGKAYTLTNANKAGFLEAYYAKLLELSTPNL